jgi:hypothetical protein
MKKPLGQNFKEKEDESLLAFNILSGSIFYKKKNLQKKYLILRIYCYSSR